MATSLACLEELASTLGPESVFVVINNSSSARAGTRERKWIDFRGLWSLGLAKENVLVGLDAAAAANLDIFLSSDPSTLTSLRPRGKTLLCLFQRPSSTPSERTGVDEEWFRCMKIIAGEFALSCVYVLLTPGWTPVPHLAPHPLRSPRRQLLLLPPIPPLRARRLAVRAVLITLGAVASSPPPPLPLPRSAAFAKTKVRQTALCACWTAICMAGPSPSFEFFGAFSCAKQMRSKTTRVRAAPSIAYTFTCKITAVGSSMTARAGLGGICSRTCGWTKSPMKSPMPSMWCIRSRQ